jgi:uncharacterized membrane protein YuzA (DUF378 family)
MNKHVYLVAMALILIGGLNWGFVGAFKWDVVQAITGRPLSRVIYVVVGLSALWLVVRRDTYLPFLGETVMPCSAIQARVPDHADKEVILHGLKPGAKILYWASEPATQGLATINTWQQAYLDFANAGVAVVDNGGHVSLRIRSPQPYTVPMYGRIERHVHWRQCGDGGMLGPVNHQLIV